MPAVSISRVLPNRRPLNTTLICASELDLNSGWFEFDLGDSHIPLC